MPPNPLERIFVVVIKVVWNRKETTQNWHSETEYRFTGVDHSDVDFNNRGLKAQYSIPKYCLFRNPNTQYINNISNFKYNLTSHVVSSHELRRRGLTPLRLRLRQLKIIDSVFVVEVRYRRRKKCFGFLPKRLDCI